MKKIFFFLLLSQCYFQISAQNCDGNLGENIFTIGDFGSGTANVLLPNPQIAPGYGYEFNPPPIDGTYTITNNTTSWGSYAASGWANIGDNSPDPFGYMMVVNASYEPGLFYEEQIDGLCENTLYSFSADIFNLIQGLGSIKPNVSFLLDNQIMYSTGDVPENLQWNTHGFAFTTDPGQTSVTLALQNNAPGGAGNDLAIDNITFRACGPEALILPEEVEYICEDGSPIDLTATINGNQYDTPHLQWQQSFDEGLTWIDLAEETNTTYAFTNLAAGNYYYRYLLANDPFYLLNSKCRVVSNVKIVSVLPKFYNIIDTLCAGLSFSLKDSLYAETGIYTDSLLSDFGCDSIVTLDLTILPDTDIQADFTMLTATCHYSADGSISIDTILNGAIPFSIFINDQVSENTTLSNILNGQFLFEIRDRYGCQFDTLINLNSPTPFLVDLGEDLIIELGNTIEINPFYSTPAQSFSWSSTLPIPCEDECESLEWAPSSSNTLSITAFSVEGNCIATDTINIQVNKTRKVYIPNAFSPNDDGINDYFNAFVSEPNVQEIERFAIYSRWGELIYEQKNFLPNSLNLGWDGTFRGENLPNDTYIYFLDIRFLDDEVVLYKGDVLLVR